MEKNINEKINDIQIIQQNIQNLAMQRQQFQIQETEIETALSEIDNSEITYKVIGNIMVKTDKELLKKQLNEKLEMLKVRIASIEKQEEKLHKTFQSLQKEVLEYLENEKKQSKNTGKH